MSQLPLVTIAIPVYNAQRFLPQGLDTVRNQTYQNLEILIADDGSSDSTATLLDHLAEQDNRIRVIHLPHQGVGATRNVLLEEANGAYLYFCDIDDYIESNLVEVNLAALEEKELDVSFFGLTFEFKATGLIDSDAPSEQIIYSNEEFKQFYCNVLMNSPYGYGYLPTKFFRMSFLRSLLEQGVKFEKIPMHEDEIFNLALFRHITRACSLSQTLYHYIIYSKGNSSTTFRPNAFESSISLFQHRIKLYNEWIKDNKKVLESYRKQLLIAVSYPIIKYEYYSQSAESFAQHLKTISHILNHPIVRECAGQCYIPLCDHPNSFFSKLIDRNFYRNRPLMFLLSRNVRDLYRKLLKKQ